MVRSPNPGKVPRFSRWKRRGVERRGHQIRIRVEAPAKFEAKPVGTQTLGKKGILQRIGMRLRRTGKWASQSFRVNLTKGSEAEVLRSITQLKAPVTEAQKTKAIAIAEQYFQEGRK